MARVSHPSPQIASLHGMVAAAHPLAARAGVAMMEKGGNAFDAAVAVASTLNVVEPFMSGVAGLGYATMWVASEKRFRVLDFVPPVPKSFPVKNFSRREELARGPHCMGTPGNLAGWAELSRSYGKLDFADLLAPAIRLAQDGSPLADFGSAIISATAKELMSLETIGDGWRKTFPQAAEIKIGHVIRQPDLAETLRTIARDGPDALYGGGIGKRIAEHVQLLGGSFCVEDLQGVQPRWREPLEVAVLGRRINVPPPPSEAFQFLLTLKILEDVNFAHLERNGPEHLDLVIRATRLAARVRIERNNPSEEDLRDIFSESHVGKLRQSLKAGDGMVGQTEQWSPDPFKDPDAAHTTSFSIVDKEGNFVCITQSLGSVFGSGIVVPGTGICLNNFLYWADVQKGSPNYTKPGADMPTCMAPSISSADGRPVLALGTPGGYGILQTQAQTMVQLLKYNCPLLDSIIAPRLRLWDGKIVEIERRIPESTIEALKAKGHEAVALEHDWTMAVGGMQAVSRDSETGLLVGIADPRRDGAAMPF